MSLALNKRVKYLFCLFPWGAERKWPKKASSQSFGNAFFLSLLTLVTCLVAWLSAARSGDLIYMTVLRKIGRGVIIYYLEI